MQLIALGLPKPSVRAKRWFSSSPAPTPASPGSPSPLGLRRSGGGETEKESGVGPQLSPPPCEAERAPLLPRTAFRVRWLRERPGGSARRFPAPAQGNQLRPSPSLRPRRQPLFRRRRRAGAGPGFWRYLRFCRLVEGEKNSKKILSVLKFQAAAQGRFASAQELTHQLVCFKKFYVTCLGYGWGSPEVNGPRSTRTLVCGGSRRAL